MWQNKAQLPGWIADLNNPPLPKHASSGIVDPPGFPSHNKSSKASNPPSSSK